MASLRTMSMGKRYDGSDGHIRARNLSNAAEAVRTRILLAQDSMRAHMRDPHEGTLARFQADLRDMHKAIDNLESMAQALNSRLTVAESEADSYYRQLTGKR